MNVGYSLERLASPSLTADFQSYSKELKDPDIDASFATNNEVNVASEQGGLTENFYA